MMEADPRIKAPTRRIPAVGIGVVFLPLCLVVVVPDSAAQIWNGSMRADYQSVPSGAGQQGSLRQQYYLRLTDRLFYKNQLTFIGTFNHRVRQRDRAAEFRPRYELLLSSAGYGGQLSYEPYTQTQPGAGGKGSEEISRRWRGGLFVQPEHWPRIACDFLRSRRTQSERGIGRERWDSYMVTWQPRSNVLSAGYSRQVRTSQGSRPDMVEIYRVLASTERALPWHHRLSMGYNFDRTWNKQSSAVVGAQDQHAGTLSLLGDPLPALNWFAQYSGRFLDGRRPGGIRERPTDHTATAAIGWTPAAVFNGSVSRYFEQTGRRQGEDGQRTDYWQGRATSEGRLYRQIRVFATAYRIVSSGAPKGMRYNDAYFLSFRGRPFRRTDWSAELSLGDRHGRQAERFGGNINIYARLEPLSSAQVQAGYTALVSAAELAVFHITEEGYNTNVQYVPADNMSLSGTWSIRRTRLASAKWSGAWSATGTYRWPSFANVSFNYSERQLSVPAGETTPPKQARRPASLVASGTWWVGTSTTVTGQYARQTSNDGATTDNWGIGISTSF